MTELWRQAPHEPIDDMRGPDDEDTTYLAGWALSAAAVVGVVLAVWQLGF